MKKRSAPAAGSRRRFLGDVSGMTAAALVGLKAQAGAQDLGPSGGQARVERAYQVRVAAALAQKNKPLLEHPDNGDEARYPNRIGNFSKGLPHNQLGEVEPSAYDALLRALASGRPEDFDRLQMGGAARLKNPQAGLAFDIQGPDPQALAQPPAPALASAEAAGEMVELYWQALTRDVNFLDYETHPLTAEAAADLSRLSDFRGPKGLRAVNREGAEFEAAFPVDRPARRGLGRVTPGTLFRGITPGDVTGPYISQFLWLPIRYGVQIISQKMRTPLAGDDYLTTYDAWLEAQRSRGEVPLPNRYDPQPRYIRNNRDLGEWVHIDVLFQAYFNAMLILLGMGAPVDKANPYRESLTECGFGTFGPPHIASVACGVASSSLRAVWYQKWYVHRRLRPEAYAGRVHHRLLRNADYPVHADVLNSAAVAEVRRRHGTYLLPMAFAEGCPTHPAYGAGHATVAGACVTILKAWFDEDFVIPEPIVPTADGLAHLAYQGPDLTVGGELNKLAANVAFGRNAAGVHWRTDAVESLKLGEASAIGILTDFKGCFNERFDGFSLTKFDGTKVTI